MILPWFWLNFRVKSFLLPSEGNLNKKKDFIFFFLFFCTLTWSHSREERKAKLVVICRNQKTMEKSVFKHFWGVGTNCHGNSLNGYVFKEIMLFSWKVRCIIQRALESYLWKACVQENQKYFINSSLWNIHADSLMFHTAIIPPKGRSWITLPCICAFLRVFCGWADLIYQHLPSALQALRVPHHQYISCW